MRAVAEAVGVTPPSIYLHFATKDELLLAVCARHLSALEQDLREAAARARDPLDALRRAGHAYIRFGLEHPEPYRLLFMGKSSAAGPEVQERDSAAIGGGSIEFFVGQVQRCMDAGLLRRGDPLRVFFTLWAAMHGLTSLLIAKRSFPWPPVEELADHLMDAVLRGLRP